MPGRPCTPEAGAANDFFGIRPRLGRGVIPPSGRSGSRILGDRPATKSGHSMCSGEPDDPFAPDTVHPDTVQYLTND